MTEDSRFGDYDSAPPKPEALIESLRAFGYTSASAIADLVDNSISAGARNVWIDFHWAGAQSWVRIRDDGQGMSTEELVEAMRAGSQSPRSPRSLSDLGRFGLGLKTASFSQCRVLTVASKRVGSSVSIRQWDLDVVGRFAEWRLLRRVDAETAEQLNTLTGDSGTVVLWQKTDRIVREATVDDSKAKDRFLRMVEEVERHLGVTFHRFLAPPSAIAIYLNGNRVSAWDPFLTAHTWTQPMPEETLWYKGNEITLKPFVLPHHSKLSEVDHRHGAGPNGWNAQQGFYVYRNRRLIVAGSWLGLDFQKEEHAKLARIRIDLPNTLDDEWQIDVRKATARPPGPIREDLRRIARATRERAVEVYRFRGKAIARSSTAGLSFVWRSRDIRGKIHYQLNRDHPAVATLLSQEAPHVARVAALRLVEETVPVPLIAMENSQSSLRQSGPLEGSTASEIEGLIAAMRDTFLESNVPLTQVAGMLLAIEPFDKYPDLVAAVLGASELDRTGDPE